VHGESGVDTDAESFELVGDRIDEPLFRDDTVRPLKSTIYLNQAKIRVAPYTLLYITGP
jgi:hypothetical protein